MFSDEAFLERLGRALMRVKLEAIIVGSAAGALAGAPVMTQDVDLLIRDTEKNREKLAALCRALGGQAVEISPLTTTRTIVGTAVPIDVLFDQISGGLSFAALRSRSVRVKIGETELVVASLEDVILSKEAAGRPKDLAQLPILRDTLRVKAALQEPD